MPLLVYESSLYGISCDVSVDNHQGRVKSKMLQLITSFDERFTDMVLLVNSFSVSLLLLCTNNNSTISSELHCVVSFHELKAICQLYIFSNPYIHLKLYQLLALLKNISSSSFLFSAIVHTDQGVGKGTKYK